MPPRIPKSLQPPKRAETIAPKPTPQVKASVEKQKKIEDELRKFQEGITYENYKARYDALSPESKKYVDSPSKIFQTEEYKQYQSSLEGYRARLQRYNEYQQGRSLARRGKFPFGSSPATIQGYQDEIQKLQSQQARWSMPQPPTQKEIDLQMSLPVGEREYSFTPKPDIEAPQLPPTGAQEVQIAPGTLERIKRSFDIRKEEQGFVKGGLSTIGDITSSLLWRGQEVGARKFEGKFDPRFTEQVGEISTIAPYFSPAGAPLLVGGGIEGLTPKQRKKFEEELKKEFSPEKAEFISYGVPLAELGLGVAGGVGAVRGVKLRRDISRARTDFFAEQVPTGDGRVVSMVASTKIGKETIPSFARGYVTPEGIQVTRGGILLERGSPFLSQTGRIGYQPGRLRPFVSVSKGGEVGTARAVKRLKDLEVGAGEGRGVIQNTISRFGRGRPVITKTGGRIEEIGQTGIYGFRGGRVRSFRITREGELKAITEKDVRGIIRVKEDPLTENTIFRGASRVKPRTKPTPQKQKVKEEVIQDVPGLAKQITEEVKAVKLEAIEPQPSTMSGLVGGIDLKRKQDASFSSVFGGRISPKEESIQRGAGRTEEDTARVFGSVFTPEQVGEQFQGERVSSRLFTPTLQLMKGKETGRDRTRPTDLIFPGEPVSPRPPRPPPVTGFKPSFPSGREDTPYNAFYKKGNEWVQINESPKTRAGALDFMARFVDENPARRGKIKKGLTKKQMREKGISERGAKVFSLPQLGGGDGYFNQNRKKFSESRYNPFEFIEKKRYASDRPKERRGDFEGSIFGGSRKTKNSKRKKPFRL